MDPKSPIGKFLLNKTIRWFCFFAVLVLTVVVYTQEPTRFSGNKSFLGITYRLHIFITFSITIFLYMFTFLGLYVTIPFSKNMPDMWYVPMFVLTYAIILQFHSMSSIINKDEDGELQPMPEYMLSRNYRYIFYYLIVIFDILIFIQFLYFSGITSTNKSTILDDFILNKFGGFVKGNKLNFIVSWLSIFGLLLDFYMVYLQLTFRPCNYNLPNNWGV